MSLFDRIKGALGFGPRLRNKPGGMAWIKGVETSAGAETLNGRAVKTVRVDAETGLWEIEPLQVFRVTRTCLFGFRKTLVRAGSDVTVCCMHDDLLEPWREIGDGAKDESKAWLPPVPKHTPAKEPCDA